VTTNRRTQPVTLSRTQARVLADRLDPVVARYASREKAARALGFKEHVLAAVVSRGASVRLPRVDFDRLVEMLGVDASRWDLARY
jgi:hypothetical protein